MSKNDLQRLAGIKTAGKTITEAQKYGPLTEQYDLDEIVENYVRAAFWSELVENKTINDVDGASKAKIKQEIEEFLIKARPMLEGISSKERKKEIAKQLGWSLETQLGFDIWMASNKKGHSFDRNPEIYGESVSLKLKDIAEQIGEKEIKEGEVVSIVESTREGYIKPYPKWLKNHSKEGYTTEKVGIALENLARSYKGFDKYDGLLREEREERKKANLDFINNAPKDILESVFNIMFPNNEEINHSSYEHKWIPEFKEAIGLNEEVSFDATVEEMPWEIAKACGNTAKNLMQNSGVGYDIEDLHAFQDSVEEAAKALVRGTQAKAEEAQQEIVDDSPPPKGDKVDGEML